MKKKLNYLVVVVQSYLQWTLKTIQIKLIHSLGGYTKEEYKIPSIAVHNRAYDKGFEYGFELGFKYLAKHLEDITIQNYGCSKQDWIDKIYFTIQEALKGNVK